MRRIGFSSWVERYFPKPGSNRGYQPAGVSVRYLRADAASYQGAVFAYCDAQQWEYVIRARRSDEMKAWIGERPASAWRPLERDGAAVDGQATCRGVWAMEGYDNAFTLVVQRTRRGTRSPCLCHRAELVHAPGTGRIQCPKAATRLRQGQSIALRG